MGPKNKNDPIGFLGLFIPTRDLFITEDTEFIALFWPIILSCRIFSRLSKEDFSVSNILEVGIPVHSLDKVVAISFSVTFLVSKIFLLVVSIFFIFSSISGMIR